MNLFTELQRRNVFKVGVAYMVAAWLVAQVVQLASEAFGAPDWIMKMLIVFLVIGFPAILFFAWAYELTPEGLRRESKVDRAGSITPETGKRLNYVTIALVVAAVAVVLIDRHYFNPAASPVDQPVAEQDAASTEADPEPPGTAVEDRSIAVLPFVNMSDDPENEYFADGLAEELLNRLAQLSELRVAGRTSSFQYKGRNLDLREIASELNVAHVLEGSVRRSGGQVRITAQLIRASDGFHLWSQTYDHTLEDIFRTQDEIAENVATNLDVVMDDRRREIMRRVGVKNVDAFIAYQKGWRMFLEAHNTDDILSGLRRANAYFRQATELYPGFGDAWYWQTDLHIHVMFEADSTPGELETAAAETERLLMAAAENAQTPQQSAFSSATRVMFSDDWRNLRTLLQRAWDTQTCAGPNWSELMAVFGMEAEVEGEMQKYLECQGGYRSMVAYQRAYEAMTVNGRLGEALALADQAIAQFGQSDISSRLRVQALMALKRHSEAIEEARLIDPDADNGYMLAMALAAAGRMEEAQAAANSWLKGEETQLVTRLELYAALGWRDKTRELVARVDARPSGHLILASTVLGCLCGAIFDTADTPNLGDRLLEASLPWPPIKAIEYPANPW